MISLVIPARNESSVIARTLRAIASNAIPGELDVVVVCNGCTDDTGSIARKFGPPVRVIETDIGNKVNALNLGDQNSSTFPRIYVDADVVISLDAIRTLARRLEQGDILAAAPLPSINLNGCSWCVRAYYDIRSRLPSAREGIGGSGAYALSKAGRQRFGKFPNVTADDGYVRIQFKPEERETVLNARSIVFAPRKIRDLISIRTRAYYGTIELERLFPDLWKNKGVSNHGAVVGLFRYPSLWLKILIYCYVNIIARQKTFFRLRAARSFWHRDETSRNAVTALSDCTDQLP